MGIEQAETGAAGVLVKELSQRPQGMSALELTEKVVERGFSRYDAQLAIRRAIDEGAVVLGPQLELRVVEHA